ncbi:meiotic recombination [Teratosphaeriaceae sp. CCFEE 6253]|nr:meiotic recombination [Teratosphaeriaceae sp. CCFEE 6253]
MSVHQNHVAHTDTSFLPERFLPTWMDLIVWGHEHECLIEPRTNVERGFRVMQPGSSVATSLMPGEAKPKQVAILSITGKEMKVEPIRLTTVRPFVMREIILMNNPEMKALSTQTVEELIEEAKEEWLRVRREAGIVDDEDTEVPKPLIRLRVDYTTPEGSHFDLENPQRYSNRFSDRVANTSDVIQFHRKRKADRTNKGRAEMPEESVLAQMEMDTVKIGQLVNEFLAAQSLTILPQNSFSDVVGQYVDKDDKHVMEDFVKASLQEQVENLVGGDEDDEVDEDDVMEMMEQYKAKLEEAFEKGELKSKNRRQSSRKPKPDWYDSEVEGPWEDDPLSIVRDDDGNAAEDGEEPEPTAKGTRSRGGKIAAGTTRKTAAAAKKAPVKAPARGKKKQIFEEEDAEDDDDDVIMTNGNEVIDLDDDDDDDDAMFVKPAAKKAPAKKAAPARKPAASKASAAGTQSKLSSSMFGSGQASQAPRATSGRTAAKAAPMRVQEPSDDEISEDDAFEPPPANARSRARK